MIKKYYIFFLLISITCNAQKISIISNLDHQPLSNVLVFDKTGNIFAKSDLNGEILKKNLEPLHDYYILKQENATEDTIYSKNFANNIITLNNKVFEIPEVVITSIANPNFVVIRGFFNNYITLNNKLNCYVDGIIEYTFDYKTKKYNNYSIVEYRTFILKEKNTDRKDISTFSFENMVRVPELEKLNLIESFKNNSNVISKEFVDIENDKISFEYSLKKREDKTVNFLGYRFTEGISASYFSFSKQKDYDLLKDLYTFNRSYQLKIKHKTEEDFNVLQGYSNFYPEKIYYLKDKKDDKKIKLNNNKSNYSSSYWQNTVLQSSYNTFSNFFKTELEEQPNAFKK